jgi:hypothetical protein
MPGSGRAIRWSWILFLILLIAAFLVRSRFAKESALRTPTSTTSVQGATAEESPASEDAPPPSPSSPSPVTAATPPAVNSQPATLSFRVSDVFGWDIKNPGLNIILSRGAGGGDREADGSLKLRLYGAEANIQVLCGDLTSTHLLRAGENVVPLAHGTEFGEVAILPADWEKVRIRPLGTSNWRLPSSLDPHIGRRFLFVTPGAYEVSDHGDFIAGRVDVVGGRRSMFTLTRLAGIKIEVAFSNESEDKRAPKTLGVTIRGVSDGASHPNGYRILLMTGNSQRKYVETGLVPGTYEVASPDLMPQFTQTMAVQGGEVRPVRIVHTLD